MLCQIASQKYHLLKEIEAMQEHQELETTAHLGGGKG